MHLLGFNIFQKNGYSALACILPTPAARKKSMIGLPDTRFLNTCAPSHFRPCIAPMIKLILLLLFYINSP